jgi:hypothetical protein
MSDTKRRLRPSPSLIISIFALVIAMSAGAYAATIAPKNSVVSKSIKNKNVKTKDLANSAASTAKIKDSAVTSPKIADSSVGSADIGDGQVGLNDLSAAARTDLNDATTLGGLTVAQIVAASGGEYYEGAQAPGTVDVEVLPAAEVALASVNLPHAGKYLVTTRVPVVCRWDGTGGGPPDGVDPDPDTGDDELNMPWFYAQSRLKVGADVVETANGSCQVESGDSFVIPLPFPLSDVQLGSFLGTTTVTMTRMVQVTGPTTLTVTGSGAPTGIGPAISLRANAEAGASMIQAITVQ